MADITIPPEALERGRIAFAKAVSADPWQDPIAAAFLAIVENWEGMQKADRWDCVECLILPLTEKTDDKA